MERYHTSSNPQKAGFAVLTTDKEDFRARKSIRDRASQNNQSIP